MVESFDQAASLLARVEDLFLLLLFVNLWTTSSSIVEVDFSLPDWDKSITWKAVKKGLADRSRMPVDLADSEYKAILDVVNSYQRTGPLERAPIIATVLRTPFTPQSMIQSLARLFASRSNCQTEAWT